MKKGYSFPWERLLVKYFRTIKAIDSEIEGLRQELCSKASFAPKMLFDVLERDDKDFLSLNDFKMFLNDKCIEFFEEGLRRFIHNFDKDNDFSICYNEYLNMILPRENDDLKAKCQKRRMTNSNKAYIGNNDHNKCGKDDIDYSIELVFVKIIQMELHLIRQLAALADELKHSKDFTTYEAFLVIVNDDKYITETNLEQFLIENNIELKGNELLTLLFRIDSDSDGKVSYEEFLEIFFPLQESASTGSSSMIAKKKETKYNNERLGQYNNDDDDNKRQLTYSISKDNNPRTKHGLSRYDNRTDNIMLNSVHENQASDCDKGIEYKTKRNNHYRRRSSLNTSEETYYPKNKLEDIPNRNHQLKENGSLTNCTTPQRPFENRLQNNSKAHLHFNHDKQKEKEKDKERLNQTYQIDYKSSTPLSIERHSSQKKAGETTATTLTFNRNKARYHIRTIPKSISRTKKQNSSNDNNNPSIHTCCGKDSSCSCCNCCSCHPGCKLERSKRILFTFLKDQVMNDSKIEEIKDEIASDNSITMPLLFEFFDEKQREFISKKDLQDKFKNIGLIVSFSDINVIFDAYDRDKDCLLNYAEFSDLLLPKKYEEAKRLNERKQSLPASFTFNNMKTNTIKLLVQLFSAVIDAEKANERNKACLLEICSIDDSFNLIKKKYSSVIYQEDMTEFLEENGLKLQQYKLDLLIERFDKNQDGLISLDEYTKAISNKSEL